MLIGKRLIIKVNFSNSNILVADQTNKEGESISVQKTNQTQKQPLIILFSKFTTKIKLEKAGYNKS